ncbi:MAG: murein hydrolase activator EnvC family protein [Gaiella sp.]
MLALIVLACLAVAVATPALGDPGDEKAQIDAQIDELHGAIGAAEERSTVLSTEIADATAKVRRAEAAISGEQQRLESLEATLGAQVERREAIDARIERLRRRIATLREEVGQAETVLAERVRGIYMVGQPDVTAFLLGATSFEELVDNVDLLNRIGKRDRVILERLQRVRLAAVRSKAEEAEARRDALELEREIRAQVEEQRAVRDRLVASRDQLVAASRERSATLAQIKEDRAHFEAEVDALEQESAALAERIRASQQAAAAAATATTSGSTSTPSAAGLVWPVAGPVTSGYGWRWGRLHEGIDIAVPEGTPVVAAAGGTVLEAGWGGGYGNLVVIDHGNGLATAYAHNSSLAVAPGSTVGQGQVVAYSGNTGSSTGPHVHFEVRVNGGSVDPLGYL